jgi:hypothetical protein
VDTNGEKPAAPNNNKWYNQHQKSDGSSTASGYEQPKEQKDISTSQELEEGYKHWPRIKK